MALDLISLDRQVARASSLVAGGRASLASSSDPARAPNPLGTMREVSSKATYTELGELPSTPLVAGLLVHVAKLTLDRVVWADEVRIASAWETPSVELADDARGPRLTPRAVLRSLLAEPDGSRRAALARGLEEGGGPVHDAAKIFAERRAEAAKLLGADLDALEVPAAPAAALSGAASELLARTEGLVECGEEPWQDAIARSIGRAQSEGWPARLSPRWIEEMFRPTRLTEGLRLELGPLPPALGAASFARALERFGRALAEAAGQRSGFFVVSRAPFDLRIERRAALFGALPADPVFGVRALGLGRDRARDQARGVARALLTTVRIDAARVLARALLERGARDREERFRDLTARTLGAPIPAALAGVVPRLRPHDAARFAGVIAAASDLRSLRHRFDEDWFRNPHAALAIREEDAAAPPGALPEPAVRGALDALVERLEQLL